MKTSEIGIKLIKHYESLHDGDLTEVGLQPKICPAGIWTEGYGHAIKDDKGNFVKGQSNYNKALQFSKIKTEKDAVDILMKDLEKFENIVNKNIKVPLKQYEFDALVSHAYNTGGSQTLFQLINDKENLIIILNWFKTKYISVNKTVLRGLVRRRESEAILFETGKLNF